MSTGVSISQQRILSLWLRRLSTDRIARQSHDSASPPRHSTVACVVAGRRGNADCLVAVNDAAEELGLRPGLALAEARAMYPALAVEPEDAQADARLLNAIADWCQRYTPLVACEGADGVLLDITGCAHLFGGEQGLRDDLTRRLTRFGFSVRVTIADTIGAAWAGSHFTTSPMVPAGEGRAFLAPLPAAALRLPAATVDLLARVGLKRIGDLLELPRAPLAARFGSALLQQLARALGQESEPLNPRLPVPAYFAEKPFAEPIALEEDILAAAEHLASRLRGMLEARGEGARNIELCLFRTDGAVRRLVVGTSRPVRDPFAIRKLFSERLVSLADQLDPGFGFDLVRLSVQASEELSPEQVGFGSHDDDGALDGLVDRLSARLGAGNIGRLVAQDSHIPELASVVLRAQTIGTGDAGWDAFRRYRRAVELSARPLRLLERPEPIEVAATIFEGPPFRFRWRRAFHDVVAIEGPERIEGAWWSEDGGPARDYFRVEDKTGLRFWLFRAGLYRDSVQPGWFMHGLFA